MWRASIVPLLLIGSGNRGYGCGMTTLAGRALWTYLSRALFRVHTPCVHLHKQLLQLGHAALKRSVCILPLAAALQ